MSGTGKDVHLAPSAPADVRRRTNGNGEDVRLAAAKERFLAAAMRADPLSRLKEKPISSLFKVAAVGVAVGLVGSRKRLHIFRLLQALLVLAVKFLKATEKLDEPEQ